MIVAAAQPGAGADWSWQAPFIGRWRLHSVLAHFVASAVVANRNVRLRIVDANGGPFLTVGLAASIVASAVQDVCFAPTLPATAFAGVITNGMPVTELLPGAVVSVTTAGLDVGDQWSAINLVIEPLEDVVGTVEVVAPGVM